ncbi:MAG: outer membrane beta-barrel protein, partial [Bryobacteraceae bacterium]
RPGPFLPTEHRIRLLFAGEGVLQRVIRICAAALTLLLLPRPGLPQEPPGATAADEREERPYELFAGYSALRESGHLLQGWTGTAVANVNHWFAIAADFDGHYGSIQEEGERVQVREHGFTIGPHFALPNRSRFTPFAFVLFGVAHESRRVAELVETATSFAADFGGGVDLHLNDRVSLRLIQVDGSYTRFEGQSLTSPRFSAGLVFHFGKPR